MTDFEVLRKIGSGASGTAFSIRHEDSGNVYCWKELHYGGMSARQKKQLVQEVNILGTLDHEHIVEYHTRIIDRKNRCIYLVQEYCEIGDLAGYLRSHSGRPSEEFVWQVMLEITSCLDYCHNHKRGKILHRDLKPQNIFLTQCGDKLRCKLGDFGVSKALNSDQMTTTKVGTPAYASPEQMGTGKYNEASDIWSLGCVLYEICMGSPPFGSSTKNDFGSHHRRTSSRVNPLTGGYSKRLNQVLMQMLKLNPNQRPSTSDILGLPRHWLNFRSPIQEKHQRRHVKLMSKMERWKASNLKQAQLEKALRQRDERKTRDLKRKKTKNEHVRQNMKSALDEIIMNRLLEIDISALERREVMAILKKLSPRNESPRTNSLKSETSSTATTETLSFEFNIEIDSFDWSLSPLGTFSSGTKDSLDVFSSFETIMSNASKSS